MTPACGTGALSAPRTWPRIGTPPETGDSVATAAVAASRCVPSGPASVSAPAGPARRRLPGRRGLLRRGLVGGGLRQGARGLQGGTSLMNSEHSRASSAIGAV
ncbi:hypothetical protein GCM10020295_43020 [Streptomyces cinereospinus]